MWIVLGSSRSPCTVTSTGGGGADPDVGGAGAGATRSRLAGTTTGAWNVTLATMRDRIGSSSRVAGAKRQALTPAAAAVANGGAPS
jgi:hypothetical protein